LLLGKRNTPPNKVNCKEDAEEERYRQKDRHRITSIRTDDGVDYLTPPHAINKLR
jgi:hypothetical protein